ncbi:MAG: hypothetical protein RR514_03005 [Christensenella sp.]
MKLYQMKAIIAKTIAILKDRSAGVDLSPLDPIIDSLIPIRENEDGSVTIKLGKINFVVRERYAEKGRDVEEIVERLVVEKCKQSA